MRLPSGAIVKSCGTPSVNAMVRAYWRGKLIFSAVMPPIFPDRLIAAAAPQAPAGCGIFLLPEVRKWVVSAILADSR